MNIAKEYRNNSVTKRRAHWLFKTRWGMLPNNSARKKKLPLALPFFKAQTSVFIVDGVICYGLEDFLDESKV